MFLFFIKSYSLDTYIYTHTVESAYFEVILIKKKNELSEYIEKEFKSVDDRSEMSYKCAGRGPNPFLSCSLIADSCL